MGLFDWIKSGASSGNGDSGGKQEAQALNDGLGELAGLNLRQVMDAHTAWKGRLQKVLDGTSDEDLDIATASEDCHCFLGKWIYSEGKKLYGNLSEYESLRTAHAKFHVCAGEVLTQHKLGNHAESANLLNTKFRSASNRNQLELVSLFTAAKR